MPDLLIELLSEEIPARMQARASEDLRRMVTDGLVEAGLTYASAGAFATPRRLTLAVEGLTARSAPLREERKGPKADAPAAAIEGFLRSTGLSRDQLELRDDKKGATLFAVTQHPGRPAAEIVAEVLEAAIRAFPWPRSMRWGAGSLRWVRPLQRILCLLSDEGGSAVVPLTVEGIASADLTEGHRTLAPGPFAVTGFDDYRARLKRAFVLLDAGERAAVIEAEAATLAFARGLEVVPDAALLAEVAGLVEWPVVLLGRIEERFLDLPAEVLQTSMRTHQKFLSVRNPATVRIEGFVTVANIATADDGATILAGNRKVLAARLSDAAFFWEKDLAVARAGMGEWAEGLKAVTFHNKLRSQAERVERIAALAREIAPMVGADAGMAEQAARVAKADLRSAMVGEFPELQGVMGRYYALAAGLDPAVADAARDHYAPLGPSDRVPSAPVSVAVALADKIDTLTGFWAIDEKPTGSKDPFALRRAALGQFRISGLSEHRLELKKLWDRPYLRVAKAIAGFSDIVFLQGVANKSGWDTTLINVAVVLNPELHIAAAHFEIDRDKPLLILKGKKEETSIIANLDRASLPVAQELPSLNAHANSLLAFLHDRLKVHLRDQGIRHDVIDACLAMPGNDDLTLLVKRAEALAATLKTDDGANLLQGYKRASNILAQAEAKDGVEYSYGADPKFAETPEERTLFATLDVAEAAIRPAMAAEDFAAAMAAMATLRAPIDAFFDATQINADNPVLRRNRLNLLHRIRAVCGGVADFSKLDG